MPSETHLAEPSAEVFDARICRAPLFKHSVRLSQLFNAAARPSSVVRLRNGSNNAPMSAR